MTTVDHRLLPETFTYREAIDKVGERSLRNLVLRGQVTQIARGVYRQTDWLGDDDLVEIATRVPRATLCLRTALARHDLIDDVPATIDVAVPRDSWRPSTTAPVSWHSFDTRTFDVGREVMAVSSNLEIGLYGPVRSIIDAYRLRGAEGPELGIEALKSWLRQGGRPGELIQMSRDFPRVRGQLLQALDVLL